MQGGYPPDYWRGRGAPRPYGGVQSDTFGKVLGLLGVSALFTLGGAVAGQFLGRPGLWLGLIGSFACVFVLGFVKERAPLNLILLYAFATLNGIWLGDLLTFYILNGLGLIVVDAAAITALVTLVAGAYGYTTKRDLTRLGPILFIGLLVVIGASILGIFIHLGPFYILISAATALLFTGFLVFDLNRIANAGEVSPGDTILLAVSVYLDIVNLFLAILRILTQVLGQRD